MTLNFQGSPCRKCGQIIKVYSSSGFCRDCFHSRKKVRVCKICQKPINAYSSSGFCRDCRPRKPHDITKYRSITVNGKSIPEHRYIWEQTHKKKLPDNWVIHHLNGLKGDNRKENLLAMPKSNHHGHLVANALKARIRELEAQITNV